MADDVLIEVLHGPYAGKRLTVADAEAKKAVKEGWARDPFAEQGEVKEMTADERFELLGKAEAGIRRLRGEGETETRAMEAEDAAEYQTKAATAKDKARK